MNSRYAIGAAACIAALLALVFFINRSSTPSTEQTVRANAKKVIEENVAEQAQKAVDSMNDAEGKPALETLKAAPGKLSALEEEYTIHGNMKDDEWIRIEVAYVKEVDDLMAATAVLQNKLGPSIWIINNLLATMEHEAPGIVAQYKSEIEKAIKPLSDLSAELESASIIVVAIQQTAGPAIAAAEEKSGKRATPEEVRAEVAKAAIARLKEQAEIASKK